jgi:CO/xanthine dehydrogenase Mo-binding subunit
VLHTETDLLPDGVGSWASRSTVVGGSAVMLAAKATAEKALRVAAGNAGGRHRGPAPGVGAGVGGRFAR